MPRNDGSDPGKVAQLNTALPGYIKVSGLISVPGT